jgi:hypothetical protein
MVCSDSALSNIAHRLGSRVVSEPVSSLPLAARGSPRPGLSPALWVPPPFCCSALWPVRL